MRYVFFYSKEHGGVMSFGPFMVYIYTFKIKYSNVLSFLNRPARVMGG